jgi:hypothetical protein
MILEHDITVRILTHPSAKTGEVLGGLKSNERVSVRYLQQSLQTRLTTLLVDRKFSLEVEVKDDLKDNSYDAIGLATYSNSQSTVWTHASIFETLWFQAELEDQGVVTQKVSGSEPSS